jgi:hypothetical protein
MANSFCKRNDLLQIYEQQDIFKRKAGENKKCIRGLGGVKSPFSACGGRIFS